MFAVRTDGTGFTVLYSFPNASDGSGPTALILSGNTLFGTAIGGGLAGGGTVFTLNTDGTGFRILHHFSAPTRFLPGNIPINSDGASPGSLVLTGNTLYGTARLGSGSGNGTIFSISLPVNRPQLTITAVGSNALLSWPTNFTGYSTVRHRPWFIGLDREPLDAHCGQWPDHRDQFDLRPTAVLSAEPMKTSNISIAPALKRTSQTRY